MFKVIHAYAFDPADKDDLFQEICLQTWRSVRSFKGDCAESTWIYRVSLNTALRWSQKEQKHQQRKEELTNQAFLLQEQEGFMDERLSWLYEEIARMDPVDRSLCLLLLEGLSYKEMADVLGITVSNIGVKIHRIKQALKRASTKLQEHGL